MVAVGVVPIGELRKRVTIQKRNETPDGQGGQVVTWTALARPWAAVYDADGREVLMQGMQIAQDMTTVVVRYRTDLSVKDRVLYGTRTFDIASISDVDGHRRFLRLFCSEVAS